MNAACLNKNLGCLGLLVQHGGSLGKVSTLQTESAIESARLTRHKKLIKFVRHLTNKDLTDDGGDFLESTDGNGQKVIFLQFTALKTLFVFSLTSSGTFFECFSTTPCVCSDTHSTPTNIPEFV